MIEAIVERIENLPPVPNVVHELQDMYYMDSYNSSDIETVIKKDPNLVANILKIANSPLYEFSREIVDIRQAIVMFGLEQIIEFALASFVEDMVDFDLGLYGIDAMQFLKMAQNKSKVVTALVDKSKERFVLSNTAFLSDISKVILSNYAKEQQIAFEVEKEISLNALDDVEREYLGTDSIEVAALMFEKWNFDQKMIELLQHFKKRRDENQEALYLAREIVALDGTLHKERGEESELAARLVRL